MIYKLHIADFEGPVLEYNSIGKHSKDFEACGFPFSFFLFPFPFSEMVYGNKKKFMMSRKVGTSANKMVHAKGTFL